MIKPSKNDEIGGTDKIPLVELEKILRLNLGPRTPTEEEIGWVNKSLIEKVG